MSGISDAERDAFPQPTRDDVVRGAACAWGYFTALSSVAITGTLVIWALANGVGIDLLPGAFGVLFLSVVIGGFVSGLVTFAWGVPAALLLARALRTVRRWPLHLVAFCVLAAATGLAVYFALRAIWGATAPVTMYEAPLIAATVALTCLSVGLGWASAWRHVSRTQVAAEPSEQHSLSE